MDETKLTPLSGPIGLVIPTILSRPQYIKTSVTSALKSGASVVLVAGPAEVISWFKTSFSEPNLIYLEDIPGMALGEKISRAIKALPPGLDYVSWIGDDDELVQGALVGLAEQMQKDSEIVLAYGDCEYIDQFGAKLFVNIPGQNAAAILNFGPQLIPQPAALFRRSAFDRAGGISGEFNLAFDFDLFLKLKKQGSFVYKPGKIANFRWHSDSLSVKRRWQSVSEASKVRTRNYPAWIRILLLFFWEPLVIFATYFAGKLLNFRLNLKKLRP